MANPKLFTGVGSEHSIYGSYPTAAHPVGTRGHLDDGRVFYYAKNTGTALAAGKLVMAEIVAGDFLDEAVAAASAIGTSTITVTLGAVAVTLNEYANGFITITDAAGEGHNYKIRSHPVAAGAASCVITIYDTVQVALTTSSKYSLMKNPWQDVLIAAAAHAHMAVGVPNTAITANEYFWCQTWGIASVWDDDATAIGASMQSGTTEGQVEIGDGAAQYLGCQLVTGADGDYTPHWLQIAP